jgi:tRNA pseudouridine55 synthase
VDRVLIVDKPRDLTSHDVVARIRRSSGARKVGHTGTLDPAATGVLIVLIGKATRLAQFFVDEEKEYRGSMVLGVTTDTQDSEGKVLEKSDASRVVWGDVERTFGEFIGTRLQIPPMVSALKRDGTPLYVLARKGVVVEREPRTIHIRELKPLSLSSSEIEFEVICSRGTYVRTLAADIGQALGCGAHLGRLERTRIGSFGVTDALSLESVLRAGRRLDALGFSMFEGLARLPTIRVTEHEGDTISTGGAIVVESARLKVAENELVRVTSDGSRLIAVGRSAESPEGLVVRPVRVFIDPL